jgi:hypothetical protein
MGWENALWGTMSMLWAHLKRLMGDQEPRLAEAHLKSHTDSPAGPSIREILRRFCFAS